MGIPSIQVLLPATITPAAIMKMETMPAGGTMHRIQKYLTVLMLSAFLSTTTAYSDPVVLVEPYDSTSWLFSVAPIYTLPLLSFDDVDAPAFSQVWGVSLLARR